MKNRYRLYRRHQSGNFYIEDTSTGKQISTRTKIKKEAQALLFSKNQAAEQPWLDPIILITAVGSEEEGKKML